MISETAVPRVAAPADHRVAAGVLMALFFAIGFLTCLNDLVVPHFKAIFSLGYAQAMLIQFSFFAAYFVASAPSGFAVRRLGYKRSILLGLMVAATGCAGFCGAAALRSYGVFLGSLFVLASGFTLLQVAANPYVAILGRKETASSRLTLTQAFNSLGTTLAPLVGSVFLVSAGDGGASSPPTTRSVQLPYLAFAAVLVVMTVALRAFRLPEARAERTAHGGRSVWSHAPLAFGALAIFVYVGAEVAIGSLLVSFLREPSVGALDARAAARCVSLYWGGAMIGRFAGSALLRRWAPPRVLAVFAVSAFALVGSAILFHGPAAMAAILSVGLFNSIMFPTIFTLAIDGLGERTGDGSGVLCMAIVGGAIVPLLEGALADRSGVQAAFAVPLVCYAYIAWYGLVGSRMRFGGRA